jgi:integrase
MRAFVMAKITHTIFADGERYPMYVDDNDIPDFWVTMFVSAKLRTSHTANSIENYIRDIVHLRRWEKIEKRDLISEFTSGRLLTEEDVHDIRDHCLLDARSINKFINKKVSESVALINANYPSAKKTFDIVCKTHYANRLGHCAEYLDFCAKTILKRNKNFKEINVEIKSMKALIKAQSSKVVRHGRNSFSSTPPPPKTFEKFMKFIHEAHPDNPYKNETIRFRNALMFEVMYETGCRSGELLSLQVGDIDTHLCKLSIQRNHDDINDPRSRQPVAKTQPRTLNISPELTDRLIKYVMEDRSKVKNANKHPYLFVTHRKGAHEGAPTSDTNFRNRILAAATNQFPELFSEIVRHGFRHDFNYRLSVKIDKNNELVENNPVLAREQNLKIINEKQEMEIRKGLNGWTSDDSAKIYTKRFTKEAADKLTTTDMEAQAIHIQKR